MAQIQNIKRTSGLTNLSGSAILYFVPYHLVSAIPKPTSPGKIADSITLSNTQKWYYWFCTHKSIKYSIKKARTRAGVSYQHELSGFIASDHQEYVAMMEAMENIRFIAIRKDNNGFFKLIGSLQQPLEFNFNFSDVSNSNRGYSFNFKCNSTSLEYFYEGQLESEDGFIQTQNNSTYSLNSISAFYAGNSFVAS